MQTFINSELSEEFNQMINTNIKWLSPLKNQNNYCEYKLKESYISKTSIYRLSVRFFIKSDIIILMMCWIYDLWNVRK